MSEEAQTLVTIVGLRGILCELSMPTSTTFWDLKHAIKAALGIQKRDQRLFVGLDAVDLRKSLVVTIPRESHCYVTLVRESAQCQHCGTGSVRLKRCSGCNGAYYCGPVCQQIDWQRHRCILAVS